MAQGLGDGYQGEGGHGLAGGEVDQVLVVARLVVAREPTVGQDLAGVLAVGLAVILVDLALGGEERRGQPLRGEHLLRVEDLGLGLGGGDGGAVIPRNKVTEPRVHLDLQIG